MRTDERAQREHRRERSWAQWSMGPWEPLKKPLKLWSERNETKKNGGTGNSFPEGLRNEQYQILQSLVK